MKSWILQNRKAITINITILSILFLALAIVRVRQAHSNREAMVLGLFDAVKTGDIQLAQSIVPFGVDLDRKNSEGDSPLVLSAKLDQTGVLSVLMLNGANPNLTDASGHTALMYAAAFNHSDIVRDLLDNGANPFLTAPDGQTALTIAQRVADDETVIALAELPEPPAANPSPNAPPTASKTR